MKAKVGDKVKIISIGSAVNNSGLFELYHYLKIGQVVEILNVEDGDYVVVGENDYGMLIEQYVNDEHIEVLEGENGSITKEK